MLPFAKRDTRLKLETVLSMQGNTRAVLGSARVFRNVERGHADRNVCPQQQQQQQQQKLWQQAFAAVLWAQSTAGGLAKGRGPLAGRHLPMKIVRRARFRTGELWPRCSCRQGRWTQLPGQRRNCARQTCLPGPWLWIQVTFAWAPLRNIPRHMVKDFVHPILRSWFTSISGCRGIGFEQRWLNDQSSKTISKTAGDSAVQSVASTGFRGSRDSSCFQLIQKSSWIRQFNNSFRTEWKNTVKCINIPSMLPPITTKFFNLFPNWSSSLSANAMLVSGPTATREISPEAEENLVNPCNAEANGPCMKIPEASGVFVKRQAESHTWMFVDKIFDGDGSGRGFDEAEVRSGGVLHSPHAIRSVVKPRILSFLSQQGLCRTFVNRNLRAKCDGTGAHIAWAKKKSWSTTTVWWSLGRALAAETVLTSSRTQFCSRPNGCRLGALSKCSRPLGRPQHFQKHRWLPPVPRLVSTVPSWWPAIVSGLPIVINQRKFSQHVRTFAELSLHGSHIQLWWSVPPVWQLGHRTHEHQGSANLPIGWRQVKKKQKQCNSMLLFQGKLCDDCSEPLTHPPANKGVQT